jgi:hypothetical protein
MTEDPGLQPQRTTFAWTRTGIGCAALTGILIRHLVLTGRTIDIVATALAGVTTVLVLVLGRRRRKQIGDRLASGHSPVTHHGVVALTVLVSMAAIAVISSVVIDDLSR